MTNNKLEAGDLVELTQENGIKLVIIVYPDGIVVNVDNTGTLEIDRVSDYSVRLKGSALSR